MTVNDSIETTTTSYPMYERHGSVKIQIIFFQFWEHYRLNSIHLYYTGIEAKILDMDKSTVKFFGWPDEWVRVVIFVIFFF